MKLVSGEEIVAKLIEADAEFYHVDAPLGVMMTQKGLQLVPALFTSDQNPAASIPKTAVTLMSHSRTDVVEAYTQSLSPIAQPSKQIIHG